MIILKIINVSEQIIEYLIQNGYSNDSINRNKSALKRLADYAESCGENEYSPDFGQRFLSHLECLYPENGQNIKIVAHSVISKADNIYYGRNIRSRKSLQLEYPEAFKQQLLSYEDYINARYSESTRTYLRKNTIIFAEFLNNNNILSLDEITPQLVMDSFKNISDRSSYTFALKIFLKFIYRAGFHSKDLSIVVPATKRSKPHPSVYSKLEVEKMLETIDRNTVSGKRSYAVLLLICRLGLRSSDVVNLKISNLNFSDSTIEFTQIKTGVYLILPMVDDVKLALLDYIDNARPDSDYQNVFLSAKPPIQPMSKATITFFVKRCMRQAEINTLGKHMGPHSLRSSLASALLSEGNSYPTIQKVLGHRAPTSTQYYAKIDIDALRKCALEVPPPSGLFEQWLSKGGESIG